jgi:hypothetical protein
VSSTVKHVERILAERIEQDVLAPIAMMGQAFPDTISRTRRDVRPGQRLCVALRGRAL